MAAATSCLDFKNVSNAGFGRPADNFTTLADNYGNQISHLERRGRRCQRTSLQRALSCKAEPAPAARPTDNCEILRALPEVNPSGLPYCHQETNWLTQFKGAASVHNSDASMSRSPARISSCPAPRSRPTGRSLASHRPVAWAPAIWRFGDADRQPARAGHRLQRRFESARPAVRQDLSGSARPARRSTSTSTTPRTRTRSSL